MSLTLRVDAGCLAGHVNNGETSGDRLARRVGGRLGSLTVGLVVTSGLLYIAMVLLVRGDWPAEGELPDGLPGVVFRIWSIFDVATERSAPTWFNAFLWSLLGLVAGAAALFARRRAGWIAFAVVAFLASLDEATSLHERLQEIGWPMAQAFGWGVVYAWVFPGVIIAAAIAIALWPLVRALPARSRNLIVAGGAVFLLGAVVLETVSGQMVGHYGVITWQNMLVTHVEELFEKLGIILAIMGVVRLFRVQRHEGGGVRIAFDDPEATRRVASS